MVVDDSEQTATLTTATINSYQALRESKIARNHARLLSLGLVHPSKPPLSSQAAEALSGRDNNPNEPKSAVQSKKRKHSTDSSLMPPPRRSLRTRGSSTISYAEDKEISPTTVISTPKTKNEYDSTPMTIEQLKEQMNENELQPLSSPVRSLAIQSQRIVAREIRLDVRQLLFGLGVDNGLLGKQMAQSGKAYVVEECIRRGSDANVPVGTNVSFNKYSGIQEWGNDVVFLWINLYAPDCDVVNEFLNHGQQVTWYGGSKMHDGTNSICQLKRIALQVSSSMESKDSGDADVSSNGHPAVVLWCRKYIASRKGFDPYICLGRLSLDSYDPKSRPLAFVWSLMDYNRLTRHPNKSVQENFQSLLRRTA